MFIGPSIFCDAAFKGPNSAAVGCAMFDSAKRLCDGSGRRISAFSVSFAEAYAIQEACCLARARGGYL